MPERAGADNFLTIYLNLGIGLEMVCQGTISVNGGTRIWVGFSIDRRMACVQK